MMKLKPILYACLGLLLMASMVHAQETDLDSLDTDSDGKVSKDEFHDYAATRLSGFPQLDEFVDQVDANDDDEISSDEFENRMTVLQTLVQQPEEEEEELDEETKKKQAADFAAATKAYDSMSGMVKDGKWDDAAELMTKKACDDYVAATVTQGVAMAKVEFPPQMNVPEVLKAKKAMKEVVELYKLGELDVSSVINIRVQVDGADQDDDKDADEKGKDENESESSDKDDDTKKMTAQEKAEAKQETLRKEILELVDKDKKRWEIVEAFRKAQKGTPFDRNSLTGEVEDSDHDDGDVFLTVVRKPDPNAGASAFNPPTVVKMKQSKDGNWQYDGIDQVRTNKKIQSFMQKMRGQMQGGRERFTEEDF